MFASLVYSEYMLALIMVISFINFVMRDSIRKSFELYMLISGMPGNVIKSECSNFLSCFYLECRNGNITFDFANSTCGMSKHDFLARSGTEFSNVGTMLDLCGYVCIIYTVVVLIVIIIHIIARVYNRRGDVVSPIIICIILVLCEVITRGLLILAEVRTYNLQPYLLNFMTDNNYFSNAVSMTIHAVTTVCVVALIFLCTTTSIDPQMSEIEPLIISGISTVRAPSTVNHTRRRSDNNEDKCAHCNRYFTPVNSEESLEMDDSEEVETV